MSEYFPLYISRKWHICIRFFCPNEILYSLKFCLWFSSIVFLEREKKGSGKSWLKKFLSIVFEQTILLHSCEVSFRMTVHPFGPESPFISHINYTLDILTLCLWFQWVLGTALWLERNVSFRKWDTNHIKNGNINGKMLKLAQLELKKKTKYLSNFYL